MTNPLDPDGETGDTVPSDEDGEGLLELRDLAGEVDPEFGPRVVRAIERRRLANHGVEFGWFAPLALLREFVDMAWSLATGGNASKEDQR